MIGLAGILASVVTVAAGALIAILAGQMAGLPDAVQDIGLLLLLPAVLGLWWLSFNFFCNVLGVSR